LGKAKTGRPEFPVRLGGIDELHAAFPYLKAAHAILFGAANRNSGLSALIALFTLFFFAENWSGEGKKRGFSRLSRFSRSFFWGTTVTESERRLPRSPTLPPWRKSPSTALLPDGKVSQLRPPLCPFPLFIFLSMVNYGIFRAGFDQTAVAPRLFAFPKHKISPTNHPRELGLLKTAPLR